MNGKCSELSSSSPLSPLPDAAPSGSDEGDGWTVEKPVQDERGAREGGPRQPGTTSGSLIELGVRTDGGIPEAGAPFIKIDSWQPSPGAFVYYSGMIPVNKRRRLWPWS